MHRWNARGLALIGCLGLSACGGGEESEESEYQVTYVPEILTAQVSTAQLPNYDVTHRFALSPAPASPVPMMFMEDSGSTFVGDTGIENLGGGWFVASMPIRGFTTTGVHSGTLTLQICKDPLCRTHSRLSGATLPYSITLTP